MKKLSLTAVFVAAGSLTLLAASAPAATPLENYYINTLLGKWQTTRMQIATGRGVDGDALSSKNSSTPTAGYKIVGVVDRKLISSGHYLMTTERLSSGLGLKNSPKVYIDNRNIVQLLQGDHAKVWVFGGSGKTYVSTDSQLRSLPHRGFQLHTEYRDGMVEDWDVYPQGHDHLSISTYHLVDGKHLLVQTEEATRIS